ncbi:MAG: hypothetical protein NZ553_09240 [Caldilinea sp.]|nr:hypothetical protein [Caldilinea sp.]MDW8440643.1 hypothetical protein [Caldilineaceae bacterium]
MSATILLKRAAALRTASPLSFAGALVGLCTCCSSADPSEDQLERQPSGHEPSRPMNGERLRRVAVLAAEPEPQPALPSKESI